MSISSRKKQILELLEQHEFLTVKKLAQLTFTSESSIRRDLADLQNQCLVRRTHGGATLSGTTDRVPTLNNRMTQNILEKRRIAKKAAALLADDQVVMLDGSSTAGFLVPYIARHINITLYTNNMVTALTAIDLGIKAHCIGGSSVNGSAVLSGEEAYRAVSSIRPDILFFSSQGIDSHGIISDSTESENYLRYLMLQSARVSVFLCDSNKFNRRCVHTLTSINRVDYAVFDSPWKELSTRCTLL